MPGAATGSGNRLITIGDILFDGFSIVQLIAQLVEISNLQIGPQANSPRVRLQFAEQDFQQGGFATAIATDHTNFVTAHDGGRKIAQDVYRRIAVAVSEADVLELCDEVATAFALLNLQIGRPGLGASLAADLAERFQGAHASFVASPPGLNALADPHLFGC